MTSTTEVLSAMIWNLSAKDLMQCAVKTVAADRSLINLDRAFLETKVSGFPVIEDGDRLVGIVSRSDVVRQLSVEQSLSEYVSDYQRDIRHYETAPDETLADIASRLGRRIEHLRVADVMIRTVISVSPQTSLRELANTLIKHHIHRAPVIDDGRLVGIVSAFDLVALIARGGGPA